MKSIKILKLTVLFLCFSLKPIYAQHNFIMLYDSIYGPLNTLNSSSQIKVAACRDGGYGLTGTGGSFISSYIIKTDSNGVIEWFRFYPVSADPNDLHGFDIIGTADSGFYYNTLQENNMFGGYAKSILYKLNKIGGIEHSKETAWGLYGTDSYTVPFNDYNISSQILTSFVYEYHYDGFGSSCCYHNSIVRMDHNLNVLQEVEHTPPLPYFGSLFSKEVQFNGLFSGVISTKTNGQKSIISMGDTLGNILWSRQYDYKGITDIIQSDSSFLLITSDSYFRKAYVHKIDYFGNTIFFKIVDTSNWIELKKINAVNDSTYYISGIKTNIGLSPGFRHPFLLEMDASGNVVQALEGIDSLTNFASIDPVSKAFLFTGTSINSGNSSIRFSKVYINNPSCNFTPITINTIDSVIIDVPFNTTSQPYTLPLVNTPHGFLISSIPFTPVCGPLGIQEAEQHSSVKVSPNPAVDYITINTGTQSQEKRKILIYGITGNEIYSEYSIDSEIKINIKGFAKGLYVVQIIGKTISSAKFIIE